MSSRTRFDNSTIFDDAAPLDSVGARGREGLSLMGEGEGITRDVREYHYRGKRVLLEERENII